MIPSALGLGPAGAATAPKGAASRGQEQADGAFRDALKQTATHGEPAETAEADTGVERSLSFVFADARWRGAMDRNGGEPPVGRAVGETTEQAPENSRAAVRPSLGKVEPVAVDGKQSATEDNEEGAAPPGEADTSPDSDAAASVVAAAATPIAIGRPTSAAPAKEAARPDEATLRGGASVRAEPAVNPVPPASAPESEVASSMPAATMATAFAEPVARPVISTDRNSQPRGMPATLSAPEPSSATGSRSAVEAPDQVTPAQQAEQTSEAPVRARSTVNSSERSRSETSPKSTPEAPVDAARPVTVSGNLSAFAPAPETPAGRQVAAAVADELADLAPVRVAVSTATNLAGTTVKTLRLQLNPVELGAVSIHMQSVNGEMKVTIRAESERAARMLQTDSDAIGSALRAVGVAAADVTIQFARTDAGQPQNTGSQGREAQGQQAGAQDNRGNASGESRQSYRESGSNDRALTSLPGGDDGDRGALGSSRLVI